METEERTTAELAVSKGVARLDAYYAEHPLPNNMNWRAGIDLERLDMEDPSLCILGQLFGRMENGLYALGFPNAHTIVASGFDVYVDREFYGYEPLQEAWKEELCK